MALRQRKNISNKLKWDTKINLYDWWAESSIRNRDRFLS